MSKRFMTYTAHEDYEKQMQTVPGFDRLFPKDKFLMKYYALLQGITEEYKLQLVIHRIENVILLKEVSDVLFKDAKHKSRFTQFRRYMKRENWKIAKDSKCLAVIYLLSSNEYFWKKFKDIMHPDRIDLSAIHLRDVGEEIYNIYQAARFFDNGTLRFELVDLTEPEIMKDSVMVLIVNALIINKYGLNAFTSRNMDTVKREASRCRV